MFLVYYILFMNSQQLAFDYVGVEKNAQLNMQNKPY